MYVPETQQGGIPPMLPRKNDTSDRDREMRRREKAQLENRLRVLKIEVGDKQRILRDYERDIRALSMSLEHVDTDMKRVGEEFRRMSSSVQGVERSTRDASAGLREKDKELQDKQEEVHRLERDIHVLKQEIAEKERLIGVVKQDVSKLMREKEDFRRNAELSHFSAKTEAEHVQERRVRLQLLEQEKKRKETEMARKERLHDETKHLINQRQQDIMEIEARLRHLNV